MLKVFHLRRFYLIPFYLIILITFFSINTFAGEVEKISWNTILPENSNISQQQQRVVNSLEITLLELESVIDRSIKEGSISYDEDFNVNGSVAIVYDYFMYRIYELMRVDRKIKEELYIQENTIKEGYASIDEIRQYYNLKNDYEKKITPFFSSLDKFKRIVLVNDIQSEIKNLKSSIGELRYALNLYSSYRVAGLTQ
ncbi:MAG: hypothetical protein A2Y48_00525 [Nitrospirae bacterium RIFCSPLOW2_12_42_9]|nr:MAG: hypothetical protein A2Y48_00525 [Nitrospirae bacterium RIFCSPLOW2_12_42_9]